MSKYNDLIKYIDVLLGLILVYRTISVNNYLRLKLGKPKENIISFINSTPIIEILKKAFVIVPFFNSSSNDKIEQLRKKINVATYAFYFLIVMEVILYF